MENQIPQLRFPEFTGDWEKKKLGDIAKVSSGGTPSRANQKYWDGNIPWVSTTLIDFNTILQANEYISDEGLANSSAKLFLKGTLLMAMYGQGKTRGKVALLGIKATINQACGAIAPNKEELNEQFLFQNLAGRYDEIRDLSNQGGQENLSGDIIKRILLNFPTLPEQTKIATFLTAVDEKLTALKQKQTLLTQYKKGVMQKIFSQELRFKDDNGNDFSDWEDKKFSLLLSEGRLGGNYENSEFNEGIPVVKMGNLGRGIINIDKIQFLPKNYAYDKRDVLQKGDLLFNTRNTLDLVGKVSIWNNELPFALYNSNLMRMKFNKEIESSNVFLNYYFNIKKSINQLRRFATGTTSVAAIYGKDLKDFVISYPTVTEQTKIANFLSAIDDKINHCNNEIVQIQTWKKGLLQQLFV